MNRLKHKSFDALFRKIQISRHKLFVFVEGKKNDPFFYGNLCNKACVGSKISHQIYTSKEVPGSLAGKPALIQFFNYLEMKSALLNEFQGKKTGIFFFLDKDLDDFLKEKIKSDHIVYTYYYDVENHIFAEGDIIKGGSASASIDPKEVNDRMGDPKNFLIDATEKWKDWVKICFFVTINKINCRYNYNLVSQINNPLTGSVDNNLYTQALERIKSRSSMDEAQFDDEFNKVSEEIDEIYRSREQDKVFKGKWYRSFLENWMIEIAKEVPADLDGLGKKIFSNIANTLDFEKSWTNHFTLLLEKIIININK